MGGGGEELINSEGLDLGLMPCCPFGHSLDSKVNKRENSININTF